MTQYKYNRGSNVIQNTQTQIIEELPYGQILGVAIFSETYWFNKSKHMDDPYKLGPFCYGILDVFPLEIPVDAVGHLGIWSLKQDAADQVAKQVSVQNKINEWKQKYGQKFCLFAT